VMDPVSQQAHGKAVARRLMQAQGVKDEAAVMREPYPELHLLPGPRCRPN
jgi:hypothetical protein